MRLGAFLTKPPLIWALVIFSAMLLFVSVNRHCRPGDASLPSLDNSLAHQIESEEKLTQTLSKLTAEVLGLRSQVENMATKLASAPAEHAPGSETQLVKKKTLLLGLFTIPSKLQRRALIRTTYLRLKPSSMDFFFVFCQPTDTAERILVAMESQQYKDIMLLPCEENMNGGKTYHYFKYVADTFGDDRYDFVMKGDDDVWWHLPNLEKRLNALPRQGTYFGREPQKTGFMAGMGYAVSWDIVRWIGNDPYPAEHTVGQEDSVFANWLHHGKKIKNWEAEDNELYDDPASGKGWAHEYTPGTIGIHRLKDEALFLNCTWHFMADLK